MLRPQSETFAKYVSYLVQNDSFTNRVSANSVGIAYPAISESKFGSFSISIPQKPEQIAISNYLDSYIDNISVMITAANKAINLLKEYRIRLNADIVTGKVDVRQAAAQLLGLPDLEEELEDEWEEDDAETEEDFEEADDAEQDE